METKIIIGYESILIGELKCTEMPVAIATEYNCEVGTTTSRTS